MHCLIYNDKIIFRLLKKENNQNGSMYVYVLNNMTIDIHFYINFMIGFKLKIISISFSLK